MWAWLILQVITSALVLGVVFAYFRRRATSSTKPWRRAARSEGEVRLPDDIDASERRVLEVLRELGELREADPTPGGRTVEVTTRANLKTSGTVVRVVLRDGPTGTVATVTGWPGAQLFDWGECKRIVEEVANRLR